jgi:hypothetical protein
MMEYWNNGIVGIDDVLPTHHSKIPVFHESKRKGFSYGR